MNNAQFHILLIEDNPDHIILINETLKQIEEVKKITIVDDGQKAYEFITKAKQKNNFPDLILLDLKLPKISGFELIKNWKNDPSLAHLYIVVLSTSDIQTDQQKALALGADRYLVKSSNFAFLHKQIQNIVRYINTKKLQLVIS